MPGIDFVLEGAVDLSQSLGLPGQMLHPEVRSAIAKIARICTDKNVVFHAVPRSHEQMAEWRDQNVSYGR